MADLGTDLSCVTDVDPTGAVVSGRRLLGEACARRLSTDRGGLLDDPNYGYNLLNFLNADIGPGDLDELQSGSEAECLKDERVLSCTVVAVLGADNILRVTVELEDSEGPFTLVLDVSSVTVDILSVE